MKIHRKKPLPCCGHAHQQYPKSDDRTVLKNHPVQQHSPLHIKNYLSHLLNSRHADQFVILRSTDNRGDTVYHTEVPPKIIFFELVFIECDSFSPNILPQSNGITLCGLDFSDSQLSPSPTHIRMKEFSFSMTFLKPLHA